MRMICPIANGFSESRDIDLPIDDTTFGDAVEYNSGGEENHAARQPGDGCPYAGFGIGVALALSFSRERFETLSESRQ